MKLFHLLNRHLSQKTYISYFTLKSLKVDFLTLFGTYFQITIIAETQNGCGKQSSNNESKKMGDGCYQRKTEMFRRRVN